MSSFHHQQQKITKHTNKWEDRAHSKGKKLNRNYPWGRPNGGLTRQRLYNDYLEDIQRAKIRCGRSQEKNVLTKRKYNKEIEHTKKNQQNREGVSELEERTLEMIQSGQIKKKYSGKVYRDLGTYGNHKVNQHLHCESLRRRTESKKGA